MTKAEEIAELKARIEELEKPEPSQVWPKIVTMYTHSEKERNWDTGEEIGLSELAIGNLLKWVIGEVEFELEVQEDGDYKILRVADESGVLRELRRD
jgi:hypothetical protein